MTIDELLIKLLAYCLASIIVTIIAKTINTKKQLPETKSYLECTKYITKNGD